MATYLLPQRLETECLENPLGIDERKPRLAWQVAASGRNIVQAAYQVQVARSLAQLDEADGRLWDSGKVRSSSICARYDGPETRSRERYFWRVRVWDQDDHPSAWSVPAWWEMGLLTQQEWSANWIEVGWDEDPKAFKPCPFFRRSFHLDGPAASARLYITSHGLYEAWLNGARAGDQVFTPGFTSYHRRLQYQVYDVTGMLRVGENVLGAILGDGWYRGKVYATNSRNVYGERLALLAMLIVETADGRVTLCTDNRWRAATGPILKSDMKDGETYDARLEMPGWCSPGFDDNAWESVAVVQHPKHNLVASMGVPVRRKEVFHPKAIIKTPKGETVLDFGQNLAGVVRMKVRGPRGTTVHLQHGEALDKDGNFATRHLHTMEPRNGKEPPFQEEYYTLKGEGTGSDGAGGGVGVEEYEPRFTVHGFRYVKVEGYPGKPAPEDFCSVAIYSDMPPTGTFTCSNPLINQLHHNVEWSMKSNFLHIPTDCPTRERAGWVGDAQIFAPTASFLMDTRAFFRKWLKDLRLEQLPDGSVTNFVPNPLRLAKDAGATWFRLLDDSAGWGDAAVMVPWALYWAYGDRQILERQYDSMKAWVDHVHLRASHVNWSKRLAPRLWVDGGYRARQKLVWDTGYQWGEWLEPGEGAPLHMFTGMTSRLLFGSPVVATAYFAHSARILANTAGLLGKQTDARKYDQLADEVKAVYIKQFIAKDGRIEPDKQASYVRVLALDLAPEELKPVIVEHLVRLVRASGNHIGTGFLSTVYLCQVLAENGRLDVAYDLLTQTSIPSWLYAVTKGATTVWETWEGIREDGTPQLSLNHYSPGAVANFLYRTVAGIEAAEPGYGRITIHPQPGGGLTGAAATYQSVYGLIASEWSIDGGRLFARAVIPPNTRAVVHLPGATCGEVLESGVPLGRAKGVLSRAQEGKDTRLEVGSGEYRFEYPYAQ